MLRSCDAHLLFLLRLRKDRFSKLIGDSFVLVQLVAQLLDALN